MKIKNFLILIFFFSISLQAQDGIVRYGEIQSMGMGAPVGPDYNAVLLFDTQRSLYLTRKDSLEGGNVYKMEKHLKMQNNHSL